MSLPHQYGSAELPAVLASSSTAASLAVQVSAWPLITGTMLHAYCTPVSDDIGCWLDSVLVHD